MSHQAPPQRRGDARPGLPSQSDRVTAADADTPADAAVLGYADLAEQAPPIDRPAISRWRDLLSFDDDPSLPPPPGHEHPTEAPSGRRRTPGQPARLPDQYSAVGSIDRTTLDGHVVPGPRSSPPSRPAHPDADRRPSPVRPARTPPVRTASSPTPAAISVAGVGPDRVEDVAAGSAPPTTPTVLTGARSPSDDQPRSLLGVAAVGVAAICVAGWWVLGPGSGQGGSGSGMLRFTSSSQVEVDDSEVRIRESVSFGRSVSTVTLAVGDPDQADVDDFAPTVDHIKVSAGETSMVYGPWRLGDEIEVALPEGTDQLKLTYVVNGAVQPGDAATDEVRGWVNPVQLIGAGGVRTVAVNGDVAGLECLESDGTTRACGRETDQGWAVQQRDRATVVIASTEQPPTL